MDQMEKKAFRKRMLQKRDAISVAEREHADEERNRYLRETKRYREAELLLFYVSYRSEADTRELLREALNEGRAVAVPKVEGQDMFFYRIDSLSQLAEGYRGIFEPDTEQTAVITSEEFLRYDAKKVLLLMPGCAFDRTGGRMGYGGGFYDRFTTQYPEFYRMALAYDVQLVDTVPREVHDMSVDAVVTETQVLEIQ